MKLISVVNRRLLKFITGGVLVGILCISGPSVSSGFPGPPLGGGGPPFHGGPPLGGNGPFLHGGPPLHGGGPGLPGSLAQGRTVGPHQPAFRGGGGEGRLGEGRGTTGEWAVCITMHKMRMRRVTVKILGKI